MKRWLLVVLALAIALGAFFRFYGLEGRPPWHDEVATRIFAAGYTPDEWRSTLYTGEIFELEEVQHFQQ
ncbi:MAG: hypothetical protein HN348_19525, partial [Proteobacteria bacterium]|nr:hypothetical protein [Pseudomonadota bacterium]